MIYTRYSLLYFTLPTSTANVVAVTVTVIVVSRGMEMHCTDCLRVTVGTRSENDQFLALLQAIAAELGVV